MHKKELNEMIKEIIQEIVYLTTPDPVMNEYYQEYKIVCILIIIVFLGMLGYAVILNI